MAWLFPIQFGNSNRPDLNSITNSLLNQMGNAYTNTVGTLVWIQCRALAIMVNTVWITNTKLVNQFNPNKMSDMLARWEAIFQIIPLPNDTLGSRRTRVAEYFFRINKVPNLSNIDQVLTYLLPETFVGLIIENQSESISAFPNGFNIIGGQDSSNGPWGSTLSYLAVETQKPLSMSITDFNNNVSQIYALLKQALPAYVEFDWIWDGFCDDGYASSDGYIAKISIVDGTTTLTGVGTAWDTPINTLDNTFNIVPGSILEAFDDMGEWQRMTVLTVNSDTSITLAEVATFNMTSATYVIQGFFLDCDSGSFPYPPVCYNLDNAGLNNV